MEFEIVFDREEDGRWIAEIESLPGVLAYGATRAEANQRSRLWRCASSPTALKLSSPLPIRYALL